MRPRLYTTVSLLLAFAAGGCSANSASRDQMTAMAAIHSFAFMPHDLSVPVGTSITWTNQDDITHTLTSGRPGTQGTPGVSKDTPASPDGVFDDELAGAGATATVVFDHAGTFTYFCRIHAGMTGEVTVT